MTPGPIESFLRQALVATEWAQSHKTTNHYEPPDWTSEPLNEKSTTHH